MFERKSVEQLVNSMVGWTRGVTTKLTDFRVGSRTRTIYEAVALVIEEMYDKVYRAVKQSIEDNLYSALNFETMSATHSSGIVTFERSLPAEENYLIPAGTIVVSKATDMKSPIQYRTTADAIIEIGTTSVDALVVSASPGELGNTEANTITEFITKPYGVDTVTNSTALRNGLDEETPQQKKLRFQLYVRSRLRGTLEAIAYGARTAVIRSSDGTITERVAQSVAFEYLETRRGVVDVYIWNGVDGASPALIAETSKILHGYYDTNGQPVYGYKPAGIQVNVLVALSKTVRMRIKLTIQDWATLEEVTPLVEDEIDTFFGNLTLAETAIHSRLLAKIGSIEAVKDVKLTWTESQSAAPTYHTNNITAGTGEVIAATKPVTYL